MNEVRLITAEGFSIGTKKLEKASGFASNMTPVQGIDQILAAVLRGHAVTIGRASRRIGPVTIVGCHIPQPEIKPWGEQK